MVPVVGTYYGQWVSGLRHGFGVRQSAPFSIATPVRHDDQQLDAAGRPRHHNSMPVLNHSLSSPADVSATLPANMEVFDRGRSGFVLTGDRERDPANVRRTSSKRSSSQRRTIADTFSLSLRRQKSDSRADAASVQVSFHLVVIKTQFTPTDCPLSCI